MNPLEIIEQLAANRQVFASLFDQKSEAMHRWAPEPNSWSLLEIACHLYDEEREDFRTRVLHTLITPEIPAPSIDPQGWVLTRDYAGQNYADKVKAFLQERKASIQILQDLEQPDWTKTYHHPALGSISAYQFLSNWLAHDYHHIRQINRRLYEYLRHSSGMDLGYAGDW